MTQRTGPTNLYCVSARETGQICYVGITTKSVAQRWYAHCYGASHSSSRAPFLAAIRKYGSDAFEIECLHLYSSRFEACEAEKELIAQFRPRYNATGGGDGGGVIGSSRSPETRAKQSAAARQRYSDPKERIRASIAARNRHPSAEARAKMSVAAKARNTPRDPMTGRFLP